MKTGASAQAEQPCCKSKLLLAMQIQKNTRLQSEPFGCFCFKVPSLEYWEHLRTSQNISGRTTNQRQAWQNLIASPASQWHLPSRLCSNVFSIHQYTVLTRSTRPWHVMATRSGMYWLLDLLSRLGHLNTLNVSLDS